MKPTPILLNTIDGDNMHSSWEHSFYLDFRSHTSFRLRVDERYELKSSTIYRSPYRNSPSGLVSIAESALEALSLLDELTFDDLIPKNPPHSEELFCFARAISDMQYGELGTLKEHGTEVACQTWDSGGPGAGAGQVSCWSIGNEFHILNDEGANGPFGSLRTALQNSSILHVTPATRSIYRDDLGVVYEADSSGKPTYRHASIARRMRKH